MGKTQLNELVVCQLPCLTNYIEFKISYFKNILNIFSGINNTSSCPPNMICNGQNKCECEKGKSFSRTKCSCLIAAGGKGCDVSKDCVDGAFCIQGHDHDHIHCDHHHHGFFISHTHCGHEYEAMTRSRCDCCKGSIGGNRDGNCPPLDANGNCPNGGQRKIISKWMIWGLAIVSIYLASNLVVQ